MPNIGRAAAGQRTPDPIGPPCPRPTIAAFGELEAQRARDRVGLGEAQGQLLADPVGVAAVLADQLARGFLVAEIFLAEGLGEHQPVTAEIGDGGEEAEWLDAGDPALDQLPDPVSEESRNVAVNGVALRLHRAPLEHRDRLADLDELAVLAGR